MLRFKKKLTVTGINGNTHGVITARSPVAKQSKKMLHIEPASAAGAASVAVALSATAPSTVTFIFSSPLGNSSPFIPSQLNEPLIAPVPALK